MPLYSFVVLKFVHEKDFLFLLRGSLLLERNHFDVFVLKEKGKVVQLSSLCAESCYIHKHVGTYYVFTTSFKRCCYIHALTYYS